MVAFAGGKLRFTKKAADQRTLAYTPWIDYTILDNTASPIVFFNDRASATQNDRLYSWPHVISGIVGEMLDIEFLHTAAMTPVTASHVVNLDALIGSVISGKKMATPYQLTIRDRVTISTSGTRTSTRGWPDNTVSVANVPSVMVRFIPERSENIVLKGTAYVVLDGA